MKVPLIYEGLHEVCALCGSESHQIEPCPDLSLQSKVEIVVEKFGGSNVLSPTNVINPSSSKEPVTTTGKWIQVSPKKRFRSMSSSSFSNQSPLKPPTLPKVTIVDPILILNGHELPPTCVPFQVHDKGTSFICTSHVPPADNLILAHPDQTINQEVPTNMAPLNAMDEDLFEEPNENDYEDSQDIHVDKEEMADTFFELESYSGFGYVL